MPDTWGEAGVAWGDAGVLWGGALALAPWPTTDGGDIIVAARWVQGGSMLVADANSGDQTISVDDVGDFNDDGGTCILDSEAADYDSIDYDANTVHLTAPLVSTHLEETLVTFSPDVQNLRAEIAMGSDPEHIEVDVPHSLAPFVPEGVYDPGTELPCRVEVEGDSWVLVDVVNRSPSFDGGFVMPGTISADKLEATIVLGSLIETAESGQRIEFDSTSFRMYNATGDEVVDISPANGRAIFGSVLLQPANAGQVGFQFEDNVGTTHDWAEFVDHSSNIQLTIVNGGDIVRGLQQGTNDLATLSNDGISFHEFADGEYRAFIGTESGVGAMNLGPGGANAHDWRIYRSGTSSAGHGVATVDNGSGGRGDLTVQGQLSATISFEVPDGSFVEYVIQTTAPASPNAGRLRVYAIADASGHPQLRVKNNLGSTKDATAFTDGA